MAAEVGSELLEAVLLEAANEVRGRSSRKWGLAIVALFLGVAITLVIVKVRARRNTADGAGEQ